MSGNKTSLESSHRPTRIRAQIPIRIRSLDLKPEFAEECHTLVVNPDGCGVRLTRPLELECRVVLEDLPGGNHAIARVANCVPLGVDGKYWLLGLALEEPGNVWCIQPVPEDWGGQAGMGAGVALPKKADEWPYALFSAKGESHSGKR
ncbi:MAG TPA: hypothetical protein VF753_13215 [Terriglobales bacterium]